MRKSFLTSLFLIIAVSTCQAKTSQVVGPESDPVCKSAAGTDYKSNYITLLTQYGDLFTSTCMPVVYTECVNTKCDDAHPENCITGNQFATEQYSLKGSFICCNTDPLLKGQGARFTTEAEFEDGKFNGQHTDLDISDAADFAVSALCK